MTVKVKIFFFLFLPLFISACSMLVLEPADFAWPVESVVKVDENGNVQERQHLLAFNAKQLFVEETGDSLSFMDKDLRVIRDVKGYYFITSDNFKNVYVFNADNGALRLNSKIAVTDTLTMNEPAFNQRSPYIELIYSGKKVNLTNEGIAEKEEDEE
jgi:hypothetical protein